MRIQLAPREILYLARSVAMRKRPYFHRALLAMTPVEREGLGGTAVDARWRYYWDPALVAEWGIERVAVDWLRKMQHLLRKHAERRAACSVHPTAWIVGTNLEINDDLMSEGFALSDAEPSPQVLGLKVGLFAEEYAQGATVIEIPGGLGGSGLGLPPGFWEVPGGGSTVGVEPFEVSAIHTAVAQAIQQYQQRWRGRGNVPSFWQVWADLELRPQRQNWRSQLFGFLRTSLCAAAGRDERSYARIDRRGVFRAELRPGAVQIEAQIAVVIDTSGSMSDRALGTALGVVDAVASVAQASITVVPCDVAVGRVLQVRSAREAIRLGASGRGGTDMRVALARCAELREKPSLVVVVTDTETPWPEKPLRCPVIVAHPRGCEGYIPSWARSVVVDFDDEEEEAA